VPHNQGVLGSSPSGTTKVKRKIVQVLEIKQISGTLSFLSEAKNSGFEQVFSGNSVANRIPQKSPTILILIL
jgi:hypothetical protein